MTYDEFKEAWGRSLRESGLPIAGVEQIEETLDLRISNTVIALMKDADPALKLTMNNGEIARVAYIKSLPRDTELRIGNMTVGEAGGLESEGCAT